MIPEPPPFAEAPPAAETATEQAWKSARELGEDGPAQDRDHYRQVAVLLGAAHDMVQRAGKLAGENGEAK